MDNDIQIRRAKIVDVSIIKQLIDDNAEEGKMIRRSLAYLYENIRDFFVLEDPDNQIVGCVALHVVWENLAEIKSLVISRTYRGKGLGSELVRATLQEAATLRLPRVFALTAVPEFFHKMGFKTIKKRGLPHKIWADCINCTYFPDDCRETAVARRIYLKKQARGS